MKIPPEKIGDAHAPCLLVSERQLARLASADTLPLLRRARAEVREQSEAYAASSRLSFDPLAHNALLTRAREAQRRILTLLVRWKMDDRPRFRSAAIAEIARLGSWTYWSSDMKRARNPEPEADYDLSYGENGTTLALAYDWLKPSLSGEEKVFFHDLVNRRVIRPFLANTARAKHEPGSVEGRRWFGHPTTNWNPVCCAGAGLAALAMGECIPGEAEVLKRVEYSIAAYMRSLAKTKGGWPEGLGYWNYGHRYAFFYLLSHERRTMRPHPLLRSPAARSTLYFPMDFSPHGVAAGFGDCNEWSPQAFHYAAARRLRAPELIGELDRRLLQKGGGTDPNWPLAAELLLMHPRRHAGASRPSKPRPVARIYPGMNWAILADRPHAPRLYLSVRGGSNAVPHAHLDLLSFNLVADGERLIANGGLQGEDYLDTTFGPRRFDLYETRPESKNTILINGVGIVPNTVVGTKLHAGKLPFLRLDATKAFLGVTAHRTPLFCGRVFVRIDRELALVLDQIELRAPGRAECRIHSEAPATVFGSGLRLQGRKTSVGIAFAANVPSRLVVAEVWPTRPVAKMSVARWCTESRSHRTIVLATVISTAGRMPKVTVSEAAGTVRITIRNRLQTTVLTARSRLKRLVIEAARSDSSS